MSRFVPLLVFLLLAGFLLVGLFLKPSEIPSPFINKPAPAFQLNSLSDPEQKLSPDMLRGKVWLLNVWASWCVSCRQEHPVLVQFAKTKLVPIYGLNYKDEPADGMNWLKQLGNPYTMSIVDREGRVGIDYGVYGVPETFIIDKQGIIRHKVIGPVSPSSLRDCVVPLVKGLNAEDPAQPQSKVEVPKACA